MKKIGKILSLSILMVVLSFPLCFASGLELVTSYPEEGSNYSMLENVMIKLEFSEDVSAANIQESNKSAFTLKGEDGKTHKVKPLYSAKMPNEIWVLIEESLTPDTEYKLTISGDLQGSDGDSLGSNQVITFKTRNTGADTTVNMVLMGVMVAGMIAFSSISMKRQMKKEAEEKGQVDKVNPYKVAKETGKSVEDIVAKTEKEKQKVQAKANKNKASTGKAEHATVEDNGNKKVKGPRTIASAGSTYITGRKAEAEKKAAEAAARAAATTTHPKNATGKSKNTKKKK